MSLFKKLFGDKKPEPAGASPRPSAPAGSPVPARGETSAPTQRSSNSAATDYPSAVKALITEALQIIEPSVAVGSQVTVVKSAGA